MNPGKACTIDLKNNPGIKAWRDHFKQGPAAYNLMHNVVVKKDATCVLLLVRLTGGKAGARTLKLDEGDKRESEGRR